MYAYVSQDKYNEEDNTLTWGFYLTPEIDDSQW